MLRTGTNAQGTPRKYSAEGTHEQDVDIFCKLEDVEGQHDVGQEGCVWASTIFQITTRVVRPHVAGPRRSRALTAPSTAAAPAMEFSLRVRRSIDLDSP